MFNDAIFPVFASTWTSVRFPCAWLCNVKGPDQQAVLLLKFASFDRAMRNSCQGNLFRLA